jgi:hypothetical protein
LRQGPAQSLARCSGQGKTDIEGQVILRRPLRYLTMCRIAHRTGPCARSWSVRTAVAGTVKHAPEHLAAALEYNILIAVQRTYRVNSAEVYRANAAECLVMASSVTDANNRKSLLDMASAWLRLAEMAEKNDRTDLVYETPPRRSDSSADSA